MITITELEILLTGIFILDTALIGIIIYLILLSI